MIHTSDAGTGGPGGPLAPPIYGISVNPIPTGEGKLSPPITTGTPNVFHLPESTMTYFEKIPDNKDHKKYINSHR